MKRRGFTLVEIMMAVSILAIVSALTWGSFNQTYKAKRQVENTAARYHTVRLTLERIARELSMAYLSLNEDNFQQERRTFFQGRRKTDIDELRFSYFGHQRLYANADECDTAQVAYYGARDRDDGSRLNLIRRETRRLSNLKLELAPGSADIVCDNVVRLQLDYWDARDKQWRDDWVTTDAAGQPNRLPGKVKVTLVVRDERGQEVPFSTEVRLPMQEPLNLTPRARTN